MVTYETITDLSQPFVKLMNVGEQIIVNNVHGYLQVRATSTDGQYTQVSN